MPNDAISEWLVWSSAWLCVGFYLLALVGWSSAKWERIAEQAWRLGCLFCVGHIVVSMHFAHGWSLDRAVAHTAERTYESTGLRWGGGVLLNFLFAAIWIADLVWRSVWPASHWSRPNIIRTGTHILLAFIVFNAAVVFAPSPMRWIALSGFVMTTAVCNRGRRLRILPPADAGDSLGPAT